MRRRELVIALAALAVAAAPASAAAPHPGARYLGFTGSETTMTLFKTSVKARISADGRSFVGRSSAKLALRCGRSTGIALAGTPVRAGRFSKAWQKGVVSYVLRGRFVSRDRATFRFSARGPGRCVSPARTGAIYEKGRPPFSGCSSQRGKTDVQNDDGRVFEQLRFADIFSEFAPFTYACLFSEDRRVLLGRNWDDEQIEVPALTAPYVGFAAVGCGGASCVSTVEVRDLPTGRLVKTLPSSTIAVPGDSTRLTALVLKANASLAWIVQKAGPTGRLFEVIADDAGGRRILDASPDVDPASLTLSGSTLGWVDGGTAESATLD